MGRIRRSRPRSPPRGSLGDVAHPLVNPLGNDSLKPRVIVLPLAALVIAGLCAWKLSRPEVAQTIPENAGTLRRPAPPFELRDQGRVLSDGTTQPSRPVRLKTYLGRHRIVLVFFDNEAGADQDPVLSALREHQDAIQKDGVIVLGISTALPQHNRQAIQRAGEIPFPLLTDLDGTVCSTWGVLNMRDDGAFRNRPGVFIIDRAGTVAWKGDAPLPVSNPLDHLDSLVTGD